MSSGDDRRPRLDRLDSLAALAGGITHELNNLAASVTMSAQLLESSCSAEADRLVLASLEDLARRLQHAGRQLHWLARGVEGEPTVFQAQYLLADVQKLARVAFPTSITVITRYPPDLWPLAGDPLVVFQLVLSLCLEARGHLCDAGTLVLAARNEERPSGRCVVLEATAEPPAGAGSGSPGSRRRAAGAAKRAAAAAGGFTTPLPRGEAGRGRRAYLPAATFSPACGDAEL
jgi:nitrogen-specific signal transduction histidine kinase